MNLKLYPHQQKIVNIAKDKYLLPHSTGTGKTITSLEIMKKKNVKNVLVICPKSIVENWKDEVKKYPNNFEVITKEYLRSHWQELKKYDGIIWDEIHYASSLKSGIYKATMAYIKKWNIRYIIGASATPYLSTPFNILALAHILGRNWDYIKFRNHFFNPIRMGNRLIWKPKLKIEKEIAKLVNNLGETINIKDCISLPPQIFKVEYFDLTVEQKKAIKEIKQTVFLPIVQFTKIHQICGGTLKGNEYEPDKFYKSEKLDRIKELCKEHPLIAIICRYNAEIELLNSKLGKLYYVAKITGKTQNKHDLIKEINQKKEAVVLINASCSEGYQLPKIPFMVFYSYDFSLKNYIQVKGRIQRIDNIKKNVYLSLLTKGTIDLSIYDNVVNKKQDFQIKIYEKR